LLESGFIKHWEIEGNRDPTGKYKEQYAHVIKYWRSVINALEHSVMEACNTLVMGFWPQTKQSMEM
jgi:hypothetical protein